MKRIAVAIAALILAAIVLPPLWYAFFPQPAAPLPPPGRRVEVTPGVGVNVLEEGSGPPVVLVHGHPGTAYDWVPLLHDLAGRGFRALAYDRVGYGRSDGRPDDNFTVAANADELLGFLKAEDLRDAVVVGWSYGGATSIVAAREGPSRMSRLVLVGSVGPGIENRPAPPEFVVEFMAGPGFVWLSKVPPLERRLRRFLTAEAFAPGPIPAGYLGQLDANFGAPHTLYSFRHEGRDLGGEADLDPSPIDLPILIIQGDGDKLVPPYVAEEIHRRAPHSELWVIAEGSHMLPITHTEAVAEAIARFTRGGMPEGK